MYVVVAGAPIEDTDRGARGLIGLPAPVGVRHASPVPSGKCRVVLAVCGADVAGWVLFRGRPFEPGHAASCQRCSQLVVWVESWAAGLQRTSLASRRGGAPTRPAGLARDVTP